MKTIGNQFRNNLGILTETEIIKLHNTNVMIVGLGGLGGHFCNNIVRLGVSKLTLIDFDKFDESNLNRQLFSNHKNLNQFKVDVLYDELVKIIPDIEITKFINKIEDIDFTNFKDIEFMIDAVDSPKTKVYLANLSAKLNIPLLHGACAGWYGQVGWITPGNMLLHQVYNNDKVLLEAELLNPSFTPSTIASIMTSEFVKYIQKSKETVINQLLLVDLYNNTMMKTGKNNG